MGDRAEQGGNQSNVRQRIAQGDMNHRMDWKKGKGKKSQNKYLAHSIVQEKLVPITLDNNYNYKDISEVVTFCINDKPDLTRNRHTHQEISFQKKCRSFVPNSLKLNPNLWSKFTADLY